MATVRSDHGTWRTLAGSGLLAGGLLWLVSILASAGVVSIWMGILAFFLVGLSLFVMAFGLTGSGGAVGTSVLGKIALVVYGIGWILLGLAGMLSLPAIVGAIAGNIIIFGGLLSAYFVFSAGIARGAERWSLFLPAVWGTMFIAGSFLELTLSPLELVPAILAALLAFTGATYLWRAVKTRKAVTSA